MSFKQFNFLQNRNELSSPDQLYSKLNSRPPKCPPAMQNQPIYAVPHQNTKSSLAHLKGLIDLSSGNAAPTANACATPPQNRRRIFLPKNLRSPFGIYRSRNNGNATGIDNNSTLSGKNLVYISFLWWQMLIMAN